MNCARTHTHDHKLITDFYFIKKILEPQKKQKQKQAVRAVVFFPRARVMWTALQRRSSRLPLFTQLPTDEARSKPIPIFLFSRRVKSETMWLEKKPKTFMTCSNKPVSTETGHHYTRFKNTRKVGSGNTVGEKSVKKDTECETGKLRERRGAKYWPVRLFFFVSFCCFFFYNQFMQRSEKAANATTTVWAGRP